MMGEPFKQKIKTTIDFFINKYYNRRLFSCCLNILIDLAKILILEEIALFSRQDLSLIFRVCGKA